MSSLAGPDRTFRGSRKPFRDWAKTVRLPAGITVRLQPGILFVFTPECFSRSPRNPVRLRPESATGAFSSQPTRDSSDLIFAEHSGSHFPTRWTVIAIIWLAAF